jgi:hypothetical protein
MSALAAIGPEGIEAAFPAPFLRPVRRAAPHECATGGPEWLEEYNPMEEKVKRLSVTPKKGATIGFR